MNRRKVLAALVWMGGSSAFPAAAFTGMTATADRPTEPAPLSAVNVDLVPSVPRISVIAVGGAGGAILSELYGKLPYLDRSIAIDIDSDNLRRVKADRKILIGGSSAPHLDNNTKSLMDEAVAGLDVVFLVVGMGGATGTSLAPQIAEVLREKQITTFAAALTPFDFDGQPRAEITRNGLDELCRLTTATFPVPPALRDQWFQPRRAHTVEQLYRSIAIPLCETGFIGRFDPADFRQILAGDGRAAMGYGSAQGKNSATTATLQAIAHPLLGLDRLRSASSVLVLVEISGTSFHMRDAIKIPVAIRNALTEHYDGHLLFGAFRTASMADDFRVTILACRNEAEAPLLKPTNLASDQRYTS